MKEKRTAFPRNYTDLDVQKTPHQTLENFVPCTDTAKCDDYYCLSIELIYKQYVSEQGSESLERMHVINRDV